MKKSLLLIISIAFTLAQTSQSLSTAANKTQAVTTSQLTNASNSDLNVEEMYHSFLAGKTEAVDKDGTRKNLYDYSATGEMKEIHEYALYDMNGDNVPELIIRSRIAIHIFWINDNELTLWYSDTAYTRPLNNMALLYERAGGAPEHTYYKYMVLGYGGEELYSVNFSEYEEDPSCPGGKKYFIDDTEVTQEVYKAQTEEYLQIGDDQIEWKPFENQ